MNKKQFRIGNLLGDRENRLCRVTELNSETDPDERNVIAPAIKGGLTSLPVEPIPLSEEWLLKCGFEALTKKSNGFKSDSYTYTGGVSLIVYFDGERLSTNFWIGNEKRYVHELQNFFYALTGEELIFTEK